MGLKSPETELQLSELGQALHLPLVTRHAPASPSGWAVSLQADRWARSLLVLGLSLLLLRVPQNPGLTSQGLISHTGPPHRAARAAMPA